MTMKGSKEQTDKDANNFIKLVGFQISKTLMTEVQMTKGRIDNDSDPQEMEVDLEVKKTLELA